MNQIGTPLPALSPQGGERVAAGRERGWFIGSFLSLLRTYWDHEPPLTRPPATLSPIGGEGRGEGWFSRQSSADSDSQYP